MSTEALNARRHGGYEVWYATWNHAATGQGFWLRHVIEGDHGELWFARFDPRDPARTFGVHRRFAGAPQTQDAPFRLALGDAELAHDHARGHLVAAGHDVQWDLSWTPAPRALRLLPDLIYLDDRLASTTVQSPNPLVAVHGELVVDGERLALAGEPFGQTHLWGKRHALAWTWARAADATAVVELWAGRVKPGGLTTPILPLCVAQIGGEELRWNQFRHLARNRAHWEIGRVGFEAHGLTARIRGELTCRPEQLVEAPYVDPDGTELFCANTEIGDARIVIERRTLRGWRTARELDLRGTAHFEIGGRERHPTVAAQHVLVSD